MARRYLLCFCLLSAMLPLQMLRATHIRAGEITMQRVSCASLTFRITVTFFLDTQSGVPIGGNDDWLEFGDGNKMLIPVQQTVPRPDLGQYMGMVVFTTDYTYSAPLPYYTVRYIEPYRNEMVVNMDQSGTTLFYVETTVYLDPFIGCNKNLPRLKAPPIDHGCKGRLFSHNAAAYDPDGTDSLSYEMNIPKRGFNTPVVNYKEPIDAKFYQNFAAGNEAKNNFPAFSIDPQNGTLKWDAPGMVGEYNVAFNIIEWKKDPSGKWRKASSVTRDMQIIVADCDNNRPDLIVPDDTCVVAGTILDKIIYGTDPDNDPVKIEVFSDVLHLVSPATYSPNPVVFQSSSPPAQLRFTWNTSCEHIREQYYQVVFKITDNPASDTKLVTFKTWRIKIVGPPPEWNDARVDLGKRNATLAWDPYTCTNASKMEIWRRIDATDYTPGECDTGMPRFLGYSLISVQNLRGSTNQFTDTNNGKGLAPGARYCYRLVAIFPNPKGGESYVSRDTCLAPILADAPVITHVTVEKTHDKEGATRISWYSPFEIDKSQFPGPYLYEVYRGAGFSGDASVRITPDNRVSDTTFVDALIDTQNEVYNYRIVLYSNTATDLLHWVAVDTSAVASSVQLRGKGTDNQITLNWHAEVPWSITSPEYPYHLIYRGDEGTAQEDFSLIDSVAVSSGFTYADNGQFENTPLDKNKTYCYRVLTRGSYGNSLLDEPFENYSQVECVTPRDDVKPCVPVLSLTPIDCNEVFATSQCMVKEFSNKIHWKVDCRDDVRSYRIFASNGPGDEFLLIADNVRDTVYIDRNLPSFARCYKIRAVDAHGNESDFSESVCSDNCPYFELPNIFTPNGDECNEYFSAYGPFNPFNQDAPESCLLGNDNYSKCLRFVERVVFRVYNRWGKEIYSYKSGKGEGSVYINWDGKDTQGQWISSGVYYYQADVTFNTLDPSKKQQTIKGWVHLIR